MVELKIDKKDKNYVEITFIGEDIALINVIREILVENDEVEFAAVKHDHIELANPVLVVRTKKGNPSTLIAKAAAKVAKMAGDLSKSL